MNLCKVITYQAPGGAAIDLTPRQIRRFERVGTWPRDGEGREYCSVAFGLHSAQHPTFSDAEVERIVAGASIAEIFASRNEGDDQ